MEQNDKFIHTCETFEIVGDHPHSGERCHVVGESPSTITKKIMISGAEIYLVHLIDCKHGMDGCYVEKKNLRFIKESER